MEICGFAAVKRWAAALYFITSGNNVICEMPDDADELTCTFLCLLGASVNVKDRCGCNFLHLVILQPKGLQNLPEEVLQVQ